MSFDERALLQDEELWIAEPPRRSPWLDGPIWWIGPLAVLAALGSALTALPASRPAAATPAHTPAETSDPAPCGETVASASASLSRN